jgi:hypothetical protein
LRLDILLLEIHEWQPIKALQTETNLVNGAPTANTDMLVANRAVESLNDCFLSYQGAIRTCLEPNWISYGSRLSLKTNIPVRCKPSL